MSNGPIGIIMLDTRFPRPVGDIGNPESFLYPVIYRRVPGASAQQAVRGDADALLAPFIAAGRELVEEGAVLIGTSCGFLSLLQAELEAALGVPVVASALSLVSKFDIPCGIITIDADALTERHLKAAGITRMVPVVGLPKDGELASVIFEDRTELDTAKAEVEMVDAARRLIDEHPEVKPIIFECTNMGPYKRAVDDAVMRPCYTIVAALQQEMQEIAG